MVDAAHLAKTPSDLNTDAHVEEKLFEKVRIDSGTGVSLPELTRLTLHDPVKIIATRALQIIQSYGVNEHTENQEFSALFFPIAAGHVKNNAPIRLVLPAFPAKSPNRVDKVLGALPDLGEELALAHLDGMCKTIAEFYTPGAEVQIASDGIVYSDILHVTDEEVWDYGEALRAIAEEKQFHHIIFVRLWDLLDHARPQVDGHGDRIYYLTCAACIRRELALRYGESEYDPSGAIKNDPDILATYMGYKKFLASDLAHENWVVAASGKEKKVHFAEIAKEMLIRGRMYANAIRERMSDCVRLSIHPSQDKTKLSVSLIPQDQGNLGYTPWHSCVAVELDGTYRTGHAAEFRDTHDLVYRNDRPHHFGARSELFRWSIDVDFEFLYPCGLIIRPSLSTKEATLCLYDSHAEDEEAFIEQAEEMGELLLWFFGIIEKVRDNGRDNTVGNPAKSNEALPMHFDGTFKLVEQIDGKTGVVKKIQQPPTYQYDRVFCASHLDLHDVPHFGIRLI
ncbi:pyoverdine dityrosine biosynthesis protein [Venturia nashicola]|uniref:Pyoverdine dityrosine biosynthesis protein n=1 Tax=Venturia nashicola TaxID=86259 RepID=A0A4Z1P0Z1_9PEZI|nr:pyoverdine dityrosine biosynthesis protein [Venturia nashicola]